MTAKLRVLVVDDSAVVRRIVTGALREDPGFEVCGEAANGLEAVDMVARLDPDAVTLDIEMPELDGLGALRRIRALKPRLPVVMFSTLTERGAVATLDALAFGADDYVTKPSNCGSFDRALAALREDLLPRLKALCRRRTAAASPAAPPVAPSPAPSAVFAPSPSAAPPKSSAPTAPPTLRRGPTRPAELLVVASSTGGPTALTAFLTALPRDVATPIVIVQHMPPLFTRLLADRLAGALGRDVREAVHDGVVPPGAVRVAPGDRHVRLVRDAGGVRTRLDDGPPENSCRPAADPLFRSAAETFGSVALGVVLTGMGKDGCEGARRIVDAGGAVFAQDEASSVVWGMPGAVAREGLASLLLPPEALAVEAARHLRRSAKPVGAGV
jgi:two-component system chemotaxis response regulator CheB